MTAWDGGCRCGGHDVAVVSSVWRVCFCLERRVVVGYGILVSIVVSIPACHAGDPGSISGREALLFALNPTIRFMRRVLRLLQVNYAS